MNRLRAIAFIWTAIVAAAQSGPHFKGRVVRITDGDTVTVLREQEQVKVRLWAIDAPERRQPFGARSRQHLGELIQGKDVLVYTHGMDRNGRTIGLIVH